MSRPVNSFTRSSLSTKQVLGLVNELLVNNEKFETIPKEYIQFGQKFGLIYPTLEQHRYIFPFAYTISYLGSSSIISVRKFCLSQDEQVIESYSNATIIQDLENVLGRITPKQSYVLVRRQGILGNPNMTLEAIGRTLNVTRERVRQIEKQCLRRLNHHSNRSKLVAALVKYMYQNRGNLIIENERIENEIKFIARSLGIPISRFPHTSLPIIGLESEEISIPRNSLEVDIVPENMQKIISSESDIPFTYHDLRVVAETYTNQHIKPVTKLMKVYQVLKEIGKPAHFSEVTRTYNEVYSDDISSERSIHGVLSRGQEGIVWIGIKGTYALAEWGFERPSSTLFETVANIVLKKYEETKKPVPFNFIQAEMGKYRKLVNYTSIVFAAHLNEDIALVSKDNFVPSYVSPEYAVSKQIQIAELDKLLESFAAKKDR